MSSDARVWNPVLPQYEKKLSASYVKAFRERVGPRPIAHQAPSIEEYRKDPVKYSFGWGGEPGPAIDGEIEKSTVVARDGYKIPINIYHGKPGNPVHINFHGGGLVIGEAGNDDAWIRYLINQTQVTVVDVDYRLGPENSFPTPMDDCVDVMRWVHKNPQLLKHNGQISLSGISAGGQITTVLSHVARDEKIPLVAAFAAVPVCDAAVMTDDFQLVADNPYASWKENYECPWLSFHRMSWFYKNFVPKGYNKKDPYLSVIHSTNFEGLPPTLILTAEVDVLFDEGNLYAEKLKQHGVDVTHKTVYGVVHSYMHLYAVEPKAVEYRKFTINWLQEQYAKATKQT